MVVSNVGRASVRAHYSGGIRDMAQGFAIGSLVVTPTGRIARVEGYDGDGRCHVLYQDCDPMEAPLTIWPKFLRPANEAGQ